MKDILLINRRQFFIQVFIVILICLIIGFLGIYQNWFTPLRNEMPIHFSVDDVIEVFMDLTENQDNYNSIFDNEMLGQFYELHQKYGIKISLYCYYEQGDFNLSMVPDKYRNDFIANGSWIKFGYHAKNSGTKLSDISPEEIEKEYLLTITELDRITGSLTHTLRLSLFQGNKEALLTLRKYGVTTFLTADDNRQSYYLDEEKSHFIADNDSYESDNLVFVSTDLRLDRLHRYNVIPRLVSIAFDSHQNKILTVFTHEWLLDDNMYEKIVDVCRFAHNYNYKFVIELP